VCSASSAPSFIAAGAGVDGTGSINVPFPAGVTSGQLLLLQLGSRSSNVPVTPTGWTLAWFDEVLNTRQRIYYKFATGTESGTLAVTCGNSNVNVGRMYSFSGVNAGTVFFEGAATSTDEDGTLPGPSVTTSAPQRLAVALVSLDNNALMSPFIGETGGDWVEAVQEFSSSIGWNFGVGLQLAALPSGGTLAGGEANLGGGSDASVCRAFALIGQ
jgi:hypothetical protein